MTGSVRVGGAWKTAVPYVKVGGAWKAVAKGSVKVGGVWKDWYTSSRPWTPADITTALWLDASDAASVTQSGGAISQVNDKSGNSRNAVQSTGTYQPTYSSAALNGLNAITFDGSNDALFINDFYANHTNIFAVVKAASNTAQMHIARKGNTGGGMLEYIFRFNTADVYWDVRPASTSVYAITATGAASTSAMVINGWWDGTNSAIYKDGAVVGTPLSAAVTQNNGDTQIRIGASFNGADNNTGVPNATWNGLMGEIVFTAGAPSTADRQRLEGYLAHKWGTAAALPSDHPYKSSAPVV